MFTAIKTKSCLKLGVDSKSICILLSNFRMISPPKSTIKSHATPLALQLQIDMNCIFQMRYQTFIFVKGLQRYWRSKLGIEIIICRVSHALGAVVLNQAEIFDLLFDLWYFCSLFIYKSGQYLIWKIWLIFVWRLKARAMKWLLTWFMFAQTTLILYHTEAFVKKEVGCTVNTFNRVGGSL